MVRPKEAGCREGRGRSARFPGPFGPDICFGTNHWTYFTRHGGKREETKLFCRVFIVMETSEAGRATESAAGILIPPPITGIMDSAPTGMSSYSIYRHHGAGVIQPDSRHLGGICIICSAPHLRSSIPGPRGWDISCRYGAHSPPPHYL